MRQQFMKKSLTILGLGTLITAVVGCQKETLTSQLSYEVESSGDSGTMDLSSIIASLKSSDNNLVVWVESGQLLYQYTNSSTMSKEAPDATFKTEDEANYWIIEMTKKGYIVEVSYNKETDMYEGRILND